MPESPLPDNGYLIDRYQIIGLLAEGMMGPVYRGLDRLARRPVAIKALKPELVIEHPSLLERFRREGEALRQLNHPNIVHLLEIVEQNGVHYLIMELMEGGSLRLLLNKQPRLPIRRVLEIGLDLADALARTHRLGIIHRDLKPENVLLTQDGIPRLSDFGVAHYIHHTTVTPPGGFAGTLAYTPPEAFLGLVVDERADIWSFGVMLFEMLAGRLPFRADKVAELISLVLTKPTPDLAGLQPELPPDLYNLIYLMLEKDRDNRLSSVRMVGAALEAIYQGQTVSTTILGKAVTPGHRTPVKLPQLSTSFVGREREIEAITAMFNDPSCRMVTITGPGGVGKTRLALQVAGRMVSRFKDGLYFVDLAPISDPELVGSRIAQVMEIKEGPARSQVESILDHIQSKQCLLVLDNLEQLIASGPLVGALISGAPRLAVLLTSREALRIYGEREYPLSPLLLPDLSEAETQEILSENEAVTLFIQRARASKPTFQLTEDNARVVAEICVRLDGLPLAIELAAARIKFFSPSQLLARLDDALGALTSGPRDRMARHQTLRGAIDWSYQLLDEGEKQLFTRLAVFKGGAGLKAIETVCGPGLAIDVVEGLESLFNKSLLLREDGRAGRPRFTYLGTIHQFARGYLERSPDSAEMFRRHAEYFAGLAERISPKLAGPKQEYWSGYLRIEYDNLRAALAWSLEGAAPKAGLRLAGALTEFWYYEGPITDGEAWLSRALTWLAEAPARTRARVLNGAGMLAFARGDYDRGMGWNQAALAIAQEEGDKENWAWSLFWLSAQSTTDPDHYQAGIAYIEEAILLFKDINNEAGLAWAYNQLGEVNRLVGNFEQAKIAYQKSLEVCRASGNRRREAIALLNSGYTAHHQGSFEEAEKVMLEGLAVLRDLKLEYHSAIALSMLVGPVTALGKARRAATLLGASSAIFERMGLDLQPADQVEIDRYTDMLHKELEQGVFDIAWASGRAMSLDQAMTYAFSQRDM